MTSEEFKELRRQTIAGIADIIAEETQAATAVGGDSTAGAQKSAERILESLVIDYADERGRFLRLKPEVAEEPASEGT